jgi:TatA/E family protein of Tat protein translocase
MFGTLGGPEIFLILVIALIVFGPRKLPEIGKSMGRMLNEFRRASNDFKRTIEDEVEAENTRRAEPARLPSPDPSAPVGPAAGGEAEPLTPAETAHVPPPETAHLPPPEPLTVSRESAPTPIEPK